ncbi:MAG: CBS domain-containing protein [Syntrophomonadaceae bacterium]|nr:CBS domain-containing protein [Syntrophomonadaceae bacterium]
MKAREIMTKDVITARPDDKVEDIARVLVDKKISGIPVTDDEGRVLGIVSEKDLLIRATEIKAPFYLTLFDSIIYVDNPVRYQQDVKKFTAAQVKDLMTKKVYSVDEDAETSEIVSIMRKYNINRVPVLRHGKLVGLVTRNDVLKALIKDE